LAMLASNNGSLEEICQRPGIKEIIEPNLNYVSQYRQNQERYRRLYRHLEEDFLE
jgi:sugar (pentulose or hexulose) kinase